MSLALVRKEWREHRGAWLLLQSFVAAVLFVAWRGQEAFAEQGSLFALLKGPTLLLATGGALFVAHRLIVREYGQRTQLFLEVLPVSRARVLATKLVLGAAALLPPLVLSLLLLWHQARAHEPISGRFVLLLLSRAFTPVLLGWCFFAFAGLLGRYRNPLYLFLLIALFAADHLTDFDLSRWGPVALLGSDFAFERHRVPWKDLLTCWALSGALAGAGFGLVLYRDGTLAELLSQRMSHREKVFIACLLVGLFVCVATWGEAKQRKPFALSEAERVTVKSSSLQVASGVGFPPERARRLAELLATDLRAVSDFLGLEQLPPVAVLPILELDADVFQRAKLEKADGVVVRANLADPDFDPLAFESFLFREVLIEASQGRVLREERQWLLDGFTSWWVNQTGAEPLPARAAVASREDFEEKHWLTTRERLGPCLSGALAARGIQVLRHRLGQAAFQELMRRVLVLPEATGFWGLWREPRLAELLAHRDGPTVDELAGFWREALRRDRESHAAVLEPLAWLQPTLTLVAESARTFRLEHALRTDSGAPPPSYALLHHALEPFENEVPTHALSRQDVMSGTSARLPLGLAWGDRWLFVVQVDSEVLGCPIRLLAQRREIR
ncbi:hypothetical protein [Cystobacter fuscus]|uniref:hypothetical protein n=1 Tax=Cystobacter fuscus TaxID=43 RepID=UPI002B317D7A|nr:hypothetical protein F0U63_34655 [Cystobacter fuscus]